MKLATARIDAAGTVATVLIEDAGPDSGEGAAAVSPSLTARVVERCDLRELLEKSSGDLATRVATSLRRDGAQVTLDRTDLLPLIPRPGKALCVGLNYREHIVEMGHPVPDYPTLFVKFSSALTSPFAEVTVPENLAAKADYEGELAVVIGRRLPGSRGGASEADARAAIAGYAVANDFSQRDWQYRTQQWLQGKNLDASSAFGPWLTTADEYDPVAAGAVLRTHVNGELRQQHSTGDLVFPPVDLVRYISEFATLEAGDVIITGTPEGVGAGSDRFLADGDVVTVSIDGLGAVETTVRM
ncbi:fumarylacetoacetate hydrolase family protein [Corynebacterium terpenotabidum]|uniref:Fumarylacetoacetate hydrolase family protein n=1 Tax=Corynebacterium terpenotabidum Y-11 TaxID=1200352 RepID=S4XHF5_9CORY|nr:fumarylacetoacetate hydrolase family protein [Corynebacterium terpenotabidum]AGP30078.1 fumarylacetoacetate hydrolase family protein [Corynebacterium terpenotabidum Y-11]